MSFRLLLAQSTPPSDGPPALPDPVPLAQIIQDGGWTMYILIGLSVLTTIIVFYYLLLLRVNVIVPQRFLFNAEEAATAGDAEALHEICRSSISSNSSSTSSTAAAVATAAAAAAASAATAAAAASAATAAAA